MSRQPHTVAASRVPSPRATHRVTRRFASGKCQRRVAPSHGRNDPMTDQSWQDKVAVLLESAIAALAPDDIAERVAVCQSTGEHGVRAHLEGQVVRFTWGGQDLLVVEGRVFEDDADLADTPVEWISTEVPDHVPSAWSDDTT